ncbi:hypothetical protein [Streptomyces ipomoeae]|uniref:hypothetical protein n=1 Tax=Streptomyces ipomoeae TaxID=103232 RepID=UPI0011479B42|nr:hypothetical protein [Streptomyces ipomoeae]TQE33139.1 hypothetical protein Sipo7851_21845 [Streptomyces ipomoeae]
MASQSGRSKRVPSGPALAHLAKLRQTNSFGQIALAADLPRSSISRLLVECRPTMSRTMAEKILAVRVIDRSTMSMVDRIGATRRLRALYALGHGRKEIAEIAKLTPQTISVLVNGGEWERITIACDDAVRRAYAQLSMAHGTCERNLLRAQREQWAPPLAWDEESIDDPRAVPVLDAQPPAPAQKDAATRFLLGESVVLDRAARKEVIAYLMEWSPHSTEEIAERLEMTPEAVDRQWERIKASAREAGEKVPWRRLVLAAV